MKFQEPAGGDGDQGRRHKRAERVERQGAGEVEAQEGGEGPQRPAAPAVDVEGEPEQASGRMGADGGPEAEGPSRYGGGEPRTKEGVDPWRPGAISKGCAARETAAGARQRFQRHPSTYWIDGLPARTCATLPS